MDQDQLSSLLPSILISMFMMTWCCTGLLASQTDVYPVANMHLVGTKRSVQPLMNNDQFDTRSSGWLQVSDDISDTKCPPGQHLSRWPFHLPERTSCRDTLPWSLVQTQETRDQHTHLATASVLGTVEEHVWLFRIRSSLRSRTWVCGRADPHFVSH